ncbi:MAG: hypothetical protein ACYSUC_10455 [Planctomycetota bacterium]|jgi:hypothetical protein
MGNIGFVALRDLSLALRDEFNITTFVETGTYKARTAAWAASEFDRVITIEAQKKRYEGAARRYRKQKRIRFVYGDSRTKLKPVLARLRKPALVWLDAHWCGNYEQSLGTPGECPLREELEALRNCSTNHLILIDDARLFASPPPRPHDPAQWPTLIEIEDLLPDGYEYTIWNDAIIAVPPEAMPIVRRFTEPDIFEVVVLTSNKYVHCLPAFAYLFNRFWDAGQAVKVVRYDVRPPKMPGNFTNFAVGIQDDYTWSQGLQRYLDHHSGELILLMLEDYFIDKPVDVHAIQEMWKYMLNHPKVVKVDLTDDRLKVGHSDFDDRLIKSDDNALFQTSTQAAIWRKDFLLRCLQSDEGPWQFERRGGKRIIAARKAGEIDGLILGFKQPPLSYVNAKGGEGTQPGEWDFKKIPAWMVKTLREKRLM